MAWRNGPKSLFGAGGVGVGLGCSPSLGYSGQVESKQKCRKLGKRRSQGGPCGLNYSALTFLGCCLLKRCASHMR
jgi:hypothetical protein